MCVLGCTIFRHLNQIHRQDSAGLIQSIVLILRSHNAFLEPGSLSRVCSKHFVDERPTEAHPDPELLLGPGYVPKGPFIATQLNSTQLDVELSLVELCRYKRALSREKSVLHTVHATQSAAASSTNDDQTSCETSSSLLSDRNDPTSISTETVVTLFALYLVILILFNYCLNLLDKFKILIEENKRLKLHVRNFVTKLVLMQNIMTVAC